MNIIDLLSVIVLGIVEGFTEFLPISSTGHLILFDEIIKFNISPEFKNMFIVVIQLGAILAVALLYFKKLNPFCDNKRQQKRTIRLWLKIIAGTIPAAIIGFIFDDIIDKYLYNGLVVATTLILYGIFFIIVERWMSNKANYVDDVSKISFQMALYIGFAQVLALIPGTSRSGATIIAAMLLGCSRVAAAEFSFFLSLPIMLGASSLKIIKYGFHYNFSQVIYLLVGIIVSFVVAAYSINLLLKIIKKTDFTFIGYYRIVLGIIVFIFYLVEKIV